LPTVHRGDGATTRTLGVDELDVHFQPIVCLDTGSQFGVEALVRCKRKAWRSPSALFEQAVNDRACGQLGRKIRDVAFSRCAGVPLFVNIHPAELSSRWLVRPDDPLGFHDSDVFLEITETASFEHFDLCARVLKEVCSRTGAFLVVDDFGAGYSNLKRLADLEPAIVKLDRELIEGLDRSRARQKLIRHVVELCIGLGARVVAEGVETLDELKATRDSGAHYVQGFLLAKPDYPVPAVNWPLTSSGRHKSSSRKLKNRSRHSKSPWEPANLPAVRQRLSSAPGRATKRPPRGR
jgi:EAL domain-containing protein (putative c-di-GMP-specific phosphodiesterase class I)